MTQKSITDALRAQFTADLAEFLAQKYDCDVCKVATGALMIPAVDLAGEDRWIKFTVVIPKEASEESGNDGYALAQEYQLKVQAAEERARKAAEKAEKAKAKAAAKS